MSSLRECFDEAADWCERHLESTRGREVGMTLGAAIRAYGRLATKPEHLLDDQEALERSVLNQKAEEMLLDFCKRFVVAYGWYDDKSKQPVQPSSQPTNMIYDPGPQN